MTKVASRAATGQERVLADDRSRATQTLMLARLLKRAFDIDMQHCLHCGDKEFKIFAPNMERPVIEKILSHLGLDRCLGPEESRRRPSRSPR